MIRLLIGLFVAIYFSNTVYITGHLKSDLHNRTTFKVSGREVLIMSENKLITKAKTDKKGNFSARFTDDIKIKVYDFYVIDSKDTILLKSFLQFENDTPDLVLTVRIK